MSLPAFPGLCPCPCPSTGLAPSPLPEFMGEARGVSVGAHAGRTCRLSGWVSPPGVAALRLHVLVLLGPLGAIPPWASQPHTHNIVGTVSALVLPFTLVFLG